MVLPVKVVTGGPFGRGVSVVTRTLHIVTGYDNTNLRHNLSQASDSLHSEHILQVIEVRFLA